MNDLMRTEDVSRETGIAAATLRFWRFQGTGPRSAKLGRRVVYRRSDVEAWINEQFETADARRSA
ncbi:helix-turn-helix transcriptional regulator [Isoptericola sp. NPDC060257]|uniref:helix-turn-helix transcriptional regulator n=1 Tax=Isoptericola sp. NPDC060257 TaxID=3347087 RepID=UPI0036487B5E